MTSYKRVEQGDPFQPSAETWNILQEVARNYKTRNQFAGNSQRFTRSPVIVEVKNNSGADRSRFDILRVTGVVFGPADNLPEFQNRYVLIGDTPDENDQVAVLQSAIPDGRVGPAVILGVTPCRVEVKDVQHNFAKIKNDATELESSGAGNIRLLYKDTGLGTKDCLALLGSGGTAGVIPVQMTQTGGAQGTTTTQPTWTYTVDDFETGENLATNYNPAAGGGSWVRHVGQMTAATAGLATVTSGDPHVFWCNEQTITEVCA